METQTPRLLRGFSHRGGSNFTQIFTQILTPIFTQTFTQILFGRPRKGPKPAGKDRNGLGMCQNAQNYLNFLFNLFEFHKFPPKLPSFPSKITLMSF